MKIRHSNSSASYKRDKRKSLALLLRLQELSVNEYIIPSAQFQHALHQKRQEKHRDK